jgi:hypothetical protein
LTNAERRNDIRIMSRPSKKGLGSSSSYFSKVSERRLIG